MFRWQKVCRVEGVVRHGQRRADERQLVVRLTVGTKKRLRKARRESTGRIFNDKDATVAVLTAVKGAQNRLSVVSR